MNLKIQNLIKTFDTKIIYALGCVYQGKNWASKVIKWSAKKEGYQIPLSHSALAVFDIENNQWMALEVVGTGYKATLLQKFLEEYNGEVYYGAFEKMRFENKYNFCMQAFKIFKEEDNDTYSTKKAIASFKFTKFPYKLLNFIIRIIDKKAQKEIGAFCSEVAFKVLLHTAIMEAELIFTDREKAFLKSKTKYGSLDFVKIYPAEMQTIFDMKLIKK